MEYITKEQAKKMADDYHNKTKLIERIDKEIEKRAKEGYYIAHFFCSGKDLVVIKRVYTTRGFEISTEENTLKLGEYLVNIKWED